MSSVGGVVDDMAGGKECVGRAFVILMGGKLASVVGRSQITATGKNRTRCWDLLFYPAFPDS